MQVKGISLARMKFFSDYLKFSNRPISYTYIGISFFISKRFISILLTIIIIVNRIIIRTLTPNAPPPLFNIVFFCETHTAVMWLYWWRKRRIVLSKIGSSY
jgi:hypothetical protein